MPSQSDTFASCQEIIVLIVGDDTNVCTQSPVTFGAKSYFCRPSQDTSFYEIDLRSNWYVYEYINLNE